MAESLIHVGGEANLRRALAIRERVLGPDHMDTGMVLFPLMWARGHDVDEHKALVDRALAIFENQPDPANIGMSWALTERAIMHYLRGEYPEAKVDFERALRIQEQLFGPVHSDVAMGLNNLATVLYDMGDYASAEPLVERTVAIDEQILPPDHVFLAMHLQSLGELRCRLGRPSEAVPYLERSLAIFKKKAPNGGGSAVTLTSLALAFDALGRSGSISRTPALPPAGAGTPTARAPIRKPSRAVVTNRAASRIVMVFSPGAIPGSGLCLRRAVMRFTRTAKQGRPRRDASGCSHAVGAHPWVSLGGAEPGAAPPLG